jgi:putative ABC transport system ATP-binding protein
MNGATSETMTEAQPAAARRKPLLEARGIVKIHGSGSLANKVLKGIDVTLIPGELTLLMGPSGSGKTTLLSIMGCLMTPTAGELQVVGEKVIGLSGEALADIRRRHIGFVFQSYNLFPTMNVLDNVLLAMDVRRTKAVSPEDMAASALIEVGLSHRIKAFPSKLSGGEKQRVAIARALAGSPSVVLADEPTAALDTENGKAVMALLSKVAQDPTRAVLAVTHDHRMLPYADRIIKIEDGHIHSDERPKEKSSTGSQSQNHVEQQQPQVPAAAGFGYRVRVKPKS